MLLYLNLPIKAGMVLVLTDETNPYKQQHPTKKRFFPEEGIEVTDKIANRFLKEKIRKVDGKDVPFLIEKPYDGEWPAKLDFVPMMPMRRKRAGQLRPQAEAGPPVVERGRRLPANMNRRNNQVEVEKPEADYDTTADNGDKGLKLKDDGDSRFTRIADRDDKMAGRKLKSLAVKNFYEMKPGLVGMAVKTLGFTWTNPEMLLEEKQAALETMCEIVSQEVEIPK